MLGGPSLRMKNKIIVPPPPPPGFATAITVRNALTFVTEEILASRCLSTKVSVSFYSTCRKIQGSLFY